MTQAQLSNLIITHLKIDDIIGLEVIQPLWNNYGELLRIHAINNSKEFSVIVKHIKTEGQNHHPRGWSGSISHSRKVQSYEVEFNWYHHWAQNCKAKVPQVLAAIHQDLNSILILEDLAIEYPALGRHLKLSEVKTVVRWLANFHAQHLNANNTDLWPIGTYWHLATRPEEFEAMEKGALKKAATQIDQILNDAQYQTIVHGDAKVANFCFSDDYKKVAAVDFQYVGSGVGVKDVMYLLSSCITEQEQTQWETEILDFYFNQLNHFIKIYHPLIDAKAVCSEWRNLYGLTIADFERFLAGWMPSHHKRNGYTEKKVNIVLHELLCR